MLAVRCGASCEPLRVASRAIVAQVGRERRRYAWASSWLGVSTFGPSGRMRLPRRASTLPGPTSTKRVAPASCRASIGLAPAHRAGQRGGELGADVLERLRGRAARRRGSAASWSSIVVERLAERRDGRLHAAASGTRRRR